VIERTALLSADGQYRYRLGRRWGTGAPVVWVMLNPSTADANEDDQTIRRCISFTKSWGHPALEVVNLFALRSTDPAALLAATDPIGSGNDDELQAVAAHAALTVVAWGSHAMARHRTREVASLLGPVYCLGTTADGSPRHPSRISSDTALKPWEPDPASVPTHRLSAPLRSLQHLLAEAARREVDPQQLRQALEVALAAV